MSPLLLLQQALVAVLVATSGLVAAQVRPECLPMNSDKKCNWDRGGEEPNPPPIPSPGQILGIVDENNFCLGMPNRNDPNLTFTGPNPTILEGEGHMQVFCLGSYSTEGSLPMPANAILSAHATKDFTVDGKHYFEVYGKMDCDVLQIRCKSPNFSDGGQYDNVPWRYYGKEPHSGVDPGLTSRYGITKYVQQAGNGIYCIRVCQGGLNTGDPCNAKMDEAGCVKTFNLPKNAFDVPGFSYYDKVTGEQRGNVPGTTSKSSKTSKTPKTSSTLSTKVKTVPPITATPTSATTTTSAGPIVVVSEVPTSVPSAPTTPRRRRLFHMMM